MERFGRDLLLMEKLAAGGMAEVYRAKHVGFGGFEKVVAVKRILPNFASNEEFQEMFRHEANLCAQFQHPNIVGVFSNGDFDGYLFLVMEFVDGKNLRQLLAKTDKNKQRIPIEISCHIVAEAARGLAYAHRFKDEATGEKLDIVHRDMSPQNIMLGYEGTVKIVDFGIAKAAARSGTTRAGVLKGKFGYMSPEQAQGQVLDRRSDIFSLGIILWELLTQRRLFSTDDDMRTLQLVRECRIVKPSRKNPNIDFALDKIVLKSLSKNRSDRYETAEEFYKDLVRYLNERFPSFIDTDFSEYMHGVFKDNIQKEKEKRDKINLEAPAVLARAPMSSKSLDDNDRTAVEDLNKTQISQIGLSDSDLARGASISAESLSEKSRDDDVEHELRELTMSALHADIGAAKQEQTGSLAASPAAQPSLRADLSYSNVSEISRAVPVKAQKAKPPRRKLLLMAVATVLVVFGLLQKGDPVANKGDLATKNEVPTQDTPNLADALPKNEISEDRDDLSSQEDTSVSSNEDGVVDAKPAPIVMDDPIENTDIRSDVASDVANSEDVEPQLVPSPVLDDGRGVAAVIPPDSGAPNTQKILSGAVEFTSLPRATAIYVNGKLLVGKDGEPMKTPLKNFTLKEGEHIVRLENKAFGASWEGRISVKAERLLKKDVLLMKSR